MEVAGTYSRAMNPRRAAARNLAAFESERIGAQVGIEVAERDGGAVRDSHLLDTGQSANAAGDLAQEGCFLRGGAVDVRSGIVRNGQPDARRDDIARIEAETNVEQIPEAAQKKGGDDEQDKRERKLGDHKNVARAGLFTGDSGAAAFLFEHQREVDAADLQGGREAENDAGDDGGPEREEQDGEVNGDGMQAWDASREEAEQRVFGKKENDESGDAADKREKQAFGKQLARETRTGRAECLPNGHFAAAGAGAGQEKVGDVGAADEQDERDGTQEKNERLADVADDGFFQRDEADRPGGFGGIVGGKLLLERGDERIEAVLGLVEREAGLDARDDIREKAPAAHRVGR